DREIVGLLGRFLNGNRFSHLLVSPLRRVFQRAEKYIIPARVAVSLPAPGIRRRLHRPSRSTSGHLRRRASGFRGGGIRGWCRLDLAGLENLIGGLSTGRGPQD